MSFLTPSGEQKGAGPSGSPGSPGSLATGLVPSAQDLARKPSIGVSPTRSRRRSTVGNVLHTAESIKERQV